MRQIILDTETTGLEPKDGHRIIEIGCVEMVDRYFTGNDFHKYINPEREVEKEAFEVHGISNEFLADKPLFVDVFTDFINYIDGAELVIHNAPFDVGFLNHEFHLLNPSNKKVEEYATIFKTLAFARKQHPGKKNNLDALCRRYNIDNTKRELHGALLDAQLLAEVYLAMTGGQMNLFGENKSDTKQQSERLVKTINKDRKPLPVIKATAEEEELHQEYLKKINAEQW